MVEVAFHLRLTPPLVPAGGWERTCRQQARVLTLTLASHSQNKDDILTPCIYG